MTIPPEMKLASVPLMPCTRGVWHVPFRVLSREIGGWWDEASPFETPTVHNQRRAGRFDCPEGREVSRFGWCRSLLVSILVRLALHSPGLSLMMRFKRSGVLLPLTASVFGAALA